MGLCIPDGTGSEHWEMWDVFSIRQHFCHWGQSMSQLHTEPEEFELLYRDPVALVGGHSPGLDVNSALLFKADIKTILIKKTQSLHWSTMMSIFMQIKTICSICIYFPGTILFPMNLFESTHTRHSNSQLVHSHGNTSWPVWACQTPVFGILSYKLWHHTLSMVASHRTVSSGCTRLDRRSHGSLTQTQSYYTDDNLTESGHILKI